MAKGNKHGLPMRRDERGRPLCGVPMCTSRRQAEGLCSGHKRGWDELGDYTKRPPSKRPPANPCMRDSCTRRAVALGLCMRCYEGRRRAREREAARKRQARHRELFADQFVGRCVCGSGLLKYENDAYCIGCAEEYQGPDFTRRVELAWH